MRYPKALRSNRDLKWDSGPKHGQISRACIGRPRMLDRDMLFSREAEKCLKTKTKKRRKSGMCPRATQKPNSKCFQGSQGFPGFTLLPFTHFLLYYFLSPLNELPTHKHAALGSGIAIIYGRKRPNIARARSTSESTCYGTPRDPGILPVSAAYKYHEVTELLNSATVSCIGGLDLF